MKLKLQVLGTMALLWGAMGGLAAQDLPRPAAKFALAQAEPVPTPAPTGKPVPKITGKPVAKQGELVILDSRETVGGMDFSWEVWADLDAASASISEDER